MKTSDGLILWSLGASGMILIYSAYKNLKPQAVLAHYFNNTAYTDADKIQTGANTPLVSQQFLSNSDPKLKNQQLVPGETPDTGNKQPRTNKGYPLVGYNTGGTDSSVIPAGYQSTPANYIPVGAMTA